MIALLWPLATFIAAAGLCVIAPRRAPLLYLGAAAWTVALIAASALYVAAIWNH